MKLLIAIIQPPKLDAVREALEKIEVLRMTVCDAQAFGRTRARIEKYRGAAPPSTVYRKVALEIVVNDDFLERTIEIITRIARTGSEGASGDGNLFVLPMDETILVSDGARGPSAV